MMRSTEQADTIMMAVIFDLDGTLVNSAEGILLSLEYAFAHNGASPSSQLESSIIGPPLREIINSLAANSNSDVKESILDSFKIHYDSLGYQKTTPFQGVESMLNDLASQEKRLAIATNKRHSPTQSILRNLKWQAYFSHVYSPDSIKPSIPTKGQLITHLLHETGWDPAQCVYIGDRVEDWHAARENGIRFGWAKWGFSCEQPDFGDNSFVLHKPDTKEILDKGIAPVVFT